MMRTRWWILGFIFPLLFFSSTSYSAELPSSVEVSIPEYTVTTRANVDYVEIPGGEILLAEEGRPRVPYYTTSIDYPNGYQVQDVILKDRSGLMMTTGLRLSVVVIGPYPESGVEMKKGWYPEEDYKWKVWENPDGSTTLVIVMYPFYYDPETTNIKFYKNYRFDIEYIVSSVAITSLTPAEDFYQPGDKVSIDISLNNSGEAQDVVVNTVITRYGSSEFVSGLPLRSLRNLIGDASLTVDWATNSVEAGYYCAEVTLIDTAGNVLDYKKVGFPLEEPTEAPKIPILYLIIGAVVITGAVASIFIIRSRKKASKPKNKV